MTTPQTNVRDRIIAWLDENDHSGWCDVDRYGEGNAACICALGKANAAIRSVLDRHHRDQMAHGLRFTVCRCRDGNLGDTECPTVRGVADTLGVST